MGEIILTPEAQNRLMVLNALQRGDLKMAEAAQVLRRSIRQVRRLRAASHRRGATALVHGNRDRPSPRRLPDPVRARILTLARTTYAGVNHVHLTELLGDRDALHVSRPTVRRILTAAGLRSPRTRRPPRHRSRRERMPHAGMLLQCDASHHSWLEQRGPQLVLHAVVDDATSQILAGWFDEAECARAYFPVFRQVALGPGLPLAAYSDRHGIFRRTRQARWTLEEQLHGQLAPTQVGRMLQELGIQWVPASSPQAKGRIERVFGALQDRLVSELRLANIRDQDAANAFLPDFVARYNARFAQAPAQPEPMYRPWPKDLDPNSVFCFKYLRTVANDNTLTVGPHLLQLLPGPHGRTYAKARVEVHERLDGTFAVWYRGRSLPVRQLTPPQNATLSARRHRRVTPGEAVTQPAPARQQRRPISGPRKSSRPSPNHPWRQYRESRKRKALREAGVTFSLNS